MTASAERLKSLRKLRAQSDLDRDGFIPKAMGLRPSEISLKVSPK